MNWSDLLKVLNGIIGVALIGGIVTFVVSRLTARDAKLREQRDGAASIRKAELDNLPVLMGLYTKRIEKLEADFKEQAKEGREREERMERETIRMNAYIVLLHSDYLRALALVPSPHALPLHTHIPDFTDHPPSSGVSFRPQQ